MSSVNTYLFALTISPVQSFISQARTTRDLYAGSAILSGLMAKALETFADKERVFPQSKEAVSNKLVVRLENKTECDIKDIGLELERKINKDFVNAIFKSACTYHDSLNNFFQVYWVAVKLDENDYKKSYKELERNLSAVKNLHTFSQTTQEAGKKKCSICGERNMHKEVNGDKLCLICFTKRKYFEAKKDEFPSLAKVALLDWLSTTENQKIADYKSLFTQSEFDEELFFKENLTESYFEKNKIKIDTLQRAKERLNTFDVSKQNKLYALIKLDVDSLGKALSNLDEDGQKELSKTLGEFAESAKQIVDRYGKTVYAGGDDFLGFVNLAYLFDAINGLYDVFKSPHTELTFSTSILIAHYKAPLHKVLEYSRELLQESKERFDDKNGVGVMVMSSNSIIAKTICRYEDFKLLEGLQKSDTAKKLHFKLHTIFDYLDVMSYDEFLTQKEMIEVEIKRLMKRENGDFDKTTYDSIIKIFNKQSIRLAANRYKIDLDNFIGYLKTLEQLRGAM